VRTNISPRFISHWTLGRPFEPPEGGHVMVLLAVASMQSLAQVSRRKSVRVRGHSKACPRCFCFPMPLSTSSPQPGWTHLPVVPLNDIFRP